MPRADLRKNGYFYYFDYFDVMILLDFLSFMCMLTYMFIYLVSSVYPTRNIRALMLLNSVEARSRDYLAADILQRGLIIQLFSYFTLSILIVVLCYIDPV